MKALRYLLGGLVAGLLAVALLPGPLSTLLADAGAQETLDVKSLRGDFAVPETARAADAAKLNTNPTALDRAYRQQPPLIPHRVQNYQITTKVNKCMNCHDWPNSTKEGAPKISETHYVDRNGVALDRVAATRWFCTQCHVAQANARDLVRNDFKPATEVE